MLYMHKTITELSPKQIRQIGAGIAIGLVVCAQNNETHNSPTVLEFIFLLISLTHTEPFFN
jgi:hypothetical protein